MKKASENKELISDKGAENKIPDQGWKIPVLEEKLSVEKQVVEKGNVKIHKTFSEEEVNLNTPTFSEEVNIERIPINKYLEEQIPAVRKEGETTIFSVVKEVVEKRLILVEEVHVSKKHVEEHVPEKVVLRKEEISIERINKDSSVE